jgi:hypothetical protein
MENPRHLATSIYCYLLIAERKGKGGRGKGKWERGRGKWDIFLEYGTQPDFHRPVKFDLPSSSQREKGRVTAGHYPSSMVHNLTSIVPSSSSLTCRGRHRATVHMMKSNRATKGVQQCNQVPHEEENKPPSIRRVFEGKEIWRSNGTIALPTHPSKLRRPSRRRTKIPEVLIVVIGDLFVATLETSSRLWDRRWASDLRSPREVLLLDDGASEVGKRIAGIVELASVRQELPREGLKFGFEGVQMILQDILSFGAHGEVLVEGRELGVVKICCATSSNLTIHVGATISSRKIALLADVLSEPLSEQSDSHPHVDVVSVSGTSDMSNFSNVATKESWIVTEHAHLHALFHDIELCMFALAHFTDRFVKLPSFKISNGVPLADQVDGGFCEDSW